MYLKTLIGSLAGQIFDFCPEAAEAMLADGRAVRAFPDPWDEPVQPSIVPTEALQASADTSATPPGQPTGRAVQLARRGRR